MNLGNTFLHVTKATAFTITPHALDRIGQRVGFRPTAGLAHVWFGRSRQVDYADMLALGYRPGYPRRKRAGKSSWYFRFSVFGEELVAVVGEGRQPGEYVWVTTYGRDAETEINRMHFAGDCVAA